MTTQVHNPYLPLFTFIPDGEPHVFDGGDGPRVYVYGSHDAENGTAFCVLDYEGWSAPVDDLGAWLCEGRSYRAEQDPTCGEHGRYMYAPDVVRGNDGRYYLYYALAGGDGFTDPIHVAVADHPAGPFEYHGEVRNPDGTTFTRGITFDPGVLNDDGTIWLYYGWAIAVDEAALAGLVGSPEGAARLRGAEMQLFGKTAEQLDLEAASETGGLQGANVVRLADNMLTVVEGPHRIVPGQVDSIGTQWEGHAFFEASSIRRIRDRYYFIYSSQLQHELCYATADSPTGPFIYGGTIISNGDIGYEGRAEEDRLAMTGNNHGSLVEAAGQWYVFYHRQTSKTTFSRQGCAEPITIAPDGSIAQVEMTSCGLNGGPLPASGTYPAAIVCNLHDDATTHTGMERLETPTIHVAARDGEHLVAEIGDGAIMAWKRFAFSGPTSLVLTVRGSASGRIEAAADGVRLGEAVVSPSESWSRVELPIEAEGTHTLELAFHGTGRFEMLTLAFE